MKRERIEKDEKFDDSNYQPGFFQNGLELGDGGPQKSQRNIYDFPDFMQNFLRLNPSEYIPEITPERHGLDKGVYVVDARKLVCPVQLGWDQEGRPLVCFRLNGKFNETGILTLYRSSQNFWKYCFCDLNCIFSPFEYDDNNSTLGNILTDTRIPCQQKVSALQGIFNKPPENSSRSAF